VTVTVCAIGGQHNGHFPFWLPVFVKFISLLYCMFNLLAEGEINIPLCQLSFCEKLILCHDDIKNCVGKVTTIFCVRMTVMMTKNLGSLVKSALNKPLIGDN